jgi:hypothetical protein
MARISIKQNNIFVPRDSRLVTNNPGRANPYLWSAPFGALALGGNPSNIFGFSLTRNSPATVQTSVSTVATGIKGTPYSLGFLSSSQQYGTVTTMPFASASKVTIGGWVKLNNNPTAGIIYELGSVWTGAGISGLVLAQNGNADINFPSSLFIGHSDSPNALNSRGYTANLTTGSWLRFVHTVDITLGTNQCNLYINGQVQSLTRAINQVCTSGIGTGIFNIGARPASLAVGTGFPHTGSFIIDFVKTGYAYNSSDAIADYSGSFINSGSNLALWDFSDSSGATVTDYGSGSKNITLTNSPTWSTDVPDLIRNRSVARIGSTGIERGLVVEENRNNRIPTRNMSETGWTNGLSSSLLSSIVIGPDGASSASQWAVSSSGYSNYRTETPPTGKYSFSHWVKGASNGESWASSYVINGAINFQNQYWFLSQSTLTTSWQRIQGTPLGTHPGNSIYFIPVDGEDRTNVIPPGFSSAARSGTVDMYQIEIGAFSTEWIATGSRAGDRLFRTNGNDCVDNGRLSLEYNLYPKGALTDYSFSPRLWTDSGNTGSFIEINNVNGVVTCSLDGITNYSNPLTWNARDNLKLFVAFGANKVTKVQYKRNNNVTIDLFVTGALLGNVTVTGSSEFLCSGSGKQLSAWVANINACKYEATPSWFNTSGSFNPLSISGLHTWFRPDYGYSVQNSTSASWVGMSGRGERLHNSGNIFPTFTGSYNGGNSAILFNGSTQYFTGSNYQLSASFTVVSVVYFASINQGSVDADYAYILGDGATSGKICSLSRWGLGFGNDSLQNKYYSIDTSNHFGPTLTGGQWKVYTQTFNRSAPFHELRINGVSQTVEDYSASIDTNGTLALGVYRNTVAPLVNHFLSGAIGEYIIYNRSLSTDEKLAIERYTGGRFGLSI